MFTLTTKLSSWAGHAGYIHTEQFTRDLGEVLACSDWSKAVSMLVQRLPFDLATPVRWTDGMEPYNCCKSADSCAVEQQPHHHNSLPDQIHHNRRDVLQQLRRSPLHGVVQAALPDKPYDQLIFASVFTHLLLLVAECEGLPVPKPLHICISSLGQDLTNELESLQKQLRNFCSESSRHQ